MDRRPARPPLYGLVPCLLLLVLFAAVAGRLGATASGRSGQQPAGSAAGPQDPADAAAADIPDSDPSLLCPVCGYGFSDSVVSGFGTRIDPFGTGRTEHHDGIDLAAPAGTPILAVADGVVSTARTANTGYGNVVILDHGDGRTSVYAHCDRLFVAEGDTVVRGQVIASVGMSGNATGPHLHFELRRDDIPQDPLDF